MLTDELQIDFPNDHDRELLNDIIGRLSDSTWCEGDPLDITDQEKVRYDWAWFSEVVMHHRRFFFEDYEDNPADDDRSPRVLLERIFECAENYDVIRVLPAGTMLFRARHQAPNTKLTSAQELGTPPKKSANQANRMSPAGIPMFYASDKAETAVRETAKRCGRFALGLFETRRAATILDLTEIPPVPSLFAVIPDSLEFRPKEVLAFLNHVADEMSKPIQRDDRVHIEYVPTQVVTEFVRSRRTEDETRIDGIKYWSAVHPNHASYAIFATQENLLPTNGGIQRPDEDRWLELVSVNEHDVKADHIEQWKTEIPERYERDYQRLLSGDE